MSVIFQGMVITAGFGKLANFLLESKNRLQREVQRSSPSLLDPVLAPKIVLDSLV